MTVPPHQLLEYVVSTYDTEGNPVTAAGMAAHFNISMTTAANQFERLRDCELLAPEGGGYRPTVTARELVELDIDDEFVIVDADTDCPG